MIPHPLRPPAGERRLAAGRQSELVVLRPDAAAPEVIYESRALIEAPNWTPCGAWLVYNADGRLWRLSVDGRQGPERIPSAPVENLNNDHLIAPDGATFFVTGKDGHVYAMPAAGGAPRRLTRPVPPGVICKRYAHGISPDGGTLALTVLRQGATGIVAHIAVMPATGGDEVLLTDGTVAVDGPDFSADGAWIWFNAGPDPAQIWRMRPDGRDARQMTDDDRVNWFPHPSPDGRWVVYLSYPPGTLGHPADCPVRLRRMPAAGGPATDLDAFTGGQGTINVPSWSPDGAALAYVRYPDCKD